MDVPAAYVADSLSGGCNSGDKLKILFWEHNGFWLYYRRLERGRFRWPASSDAPLLVTRRQLQWLLDGLSIEEKRAHKPVRIERAAWTTMWVPFDAYECPAHIAR